MSDENKAWTARPMIHMPSAIVGFGLCMLITIGASKIDMTRNPPLVPVRAELVKQKTQCEADIPRSQVCKAVVYWEVADKKETK